MNELTFFKDVGLAILGATVMAVPAYLLNIPLLLSFLAAGVALGPHLGFGFIQDSVNISILSEIGLVLLMFILGLEIDVRKLIQASKAVLVNGVTQFIGCMILAWGFFSLIGFKNADGKFELTYLAVACSLSSTLIVIKILSERMELDTFLSRITLGILVFQDLWAIGFLALQPNLNQLNPVTLALSLGGAGLLILFCWLAAKFILPHIFIRVARQSELVLLVAMGWCFAMCGLAHSLHLSLEMGALLAGIMVASLPYHVDIAAKVASLRDFFITLFFVSLGLQIPKPTMYEIYVSAAISVFVIVSRLLTIYPVLYKLRYGNRASLLPALNLGQLSEFSLVLGSLGVAYGHIRPELFSAFVMSLVITALISSYVIPYGHQVYKFLNPILESLGFKDLVVALDEDKPKDEQTDLVLLGFFRDASSLLQELIDRHSEAAIKRLLVVDFNPEAHQKLMDRGIRCQYADISNEDVLKTLRLEQAKVLVCTIPDSNLKGTTNLKLLNTLKKIAPKSEIIVTAVSTSQAKEMYAQGADYVFIPRLIASHYLADVLEKLSLGEKTTIKTSAITFLNSWNEVLD